MLKAKTNAMTNSSIPNCVAMKSETLTNQNNINSFSVGRRPSNVLLLRFVFSSSSSHSCRSLCLANFKANDIIINVECDNKLCWLNDCSYLVVVTVLQIWRQLDRSRFLICLAQSVAIVNANACRKSKSLLKMIAVAVFFFGWTGRLLLLPATTQLWKISNKIYCPNRGREPMASFPF